MALGLFNGVSLERLWATGQIVIIGIRVGPMWTRMYRWVSISYTSLGPPPREGLGVLLEDWGGRSSCPPLNSFDGLMGHKDVIEAIRTWVR